MHRHFVLLVAAFAIVFALDVESGAVDRIVLKDGNVVEGEIVRTTVRDITVKGRFGMITFPLKRVQRVRENGKFWTPPETPEEEEPSQEQLEFGWGQSELKQRLLRWIEEIEANPIGLWTTYPKEPAPAKVEQLYRRLKDGEYSYNDRLPLTGDAFERIWVHQREKLSGELGGIGAGATLPGSGSAYYWVPLYWHETTGRWLPTHPLQSAFRWEENQVAKMLARVANASGRSNASRLEALVEKLEQSPENHDELKKKLKQLTAAVAGEWKGEEILYRIYVTNVAIAHASDREKVDLARERRADLRQLISVVP